MSTMNYRAASRLMCCAAVLTLAGCTLLTPEWHPRRQAEAGCAEDAMQYCVINNYGKRCECSSRQSVEAVLRSHQ